VAGVNWFTTKQKLLTKEFNVFINRSEEWKGRKQAYAKAKTAVAGFLTKYENHLRQSPWLAD
jgi:hypothetical protein